MPPLPDMTEREKIIAYKIVRMLVDYPVDEAREILHQVTTKLDIHLREPNASAR